MSETLPPIPSTAVPLVSDLAGADLVVAYQSDGNGGWTVAAAPFSDMAALVAPQIALNGSVIQIQPPGAPIARDLADHFGEVINVKDYGAKGDLIIAEGAFAYTGNTITIAGAAFTAADAGKWITLPAGGDNAGASVPVLTQLTGTPSGTTAQVAAAAAHAVSGVTTQLYHYLQASSFTVNAPGTGYSVGDSLTLLSGAFARPGSLRVILTKAITATVVGGGSLGPAGSNVTITGTTGYGKRFQATGTIDNSGHLAGALTVTTPGAYWFNVSNAAIEPVTARPATISTRATFSGSSTAVAVTSSAGMLRGNLIAATGIPAGATITDIQGNNLTISTPTTLPGAAVTCTVTGNSAPISTTATFTLNSPTITVSNATGLVRGMVVGGTGIAGTGDPKNSLSTTITDINGTTITLSANTVLTANSPVTFTAYPMLVGATVALSFGVAAVCGNDPGAYSALPVFPASVTGGTGTGATFTPPTTAIRLPYFTDDTGAINAAFIKARAIYNAAVFPKEGAVCVVLPAGCYGCLGTIDQTRIKSNGFRIDAQGVEIFSFAAGKIAWDAFDTRFTHMDGPLYIWGDQSFQPKLGFSAGNVGNGVADKLFYKSLRCNGFFNLGGWSAKSTETSSFPDLQVYNASANPNSYGIIADALNFFGISSDFAPQTLPYLDTGSFGGLRLTNLDVRHGGAGSPVWAGHIQDAFIDGYVNGFSRPGVMLFSTLAGGGDASFNTRWDIGFETPSMQDGFFIFGNNMSMTMAGLTFRSGGPNPSNSLIAVDTLGAFGSAAAALSLFDLDLDVGVLEAGAVVFDAPSITFASGSFKIANPQAAWNTPAQFQGWQLVERNLTITANSLFSLSAAFGDIAVSNFVRTNFLAVASGIFAGPAGLPPTAAFGTDTANGNFSLGAAGTVQNPFQGTPYFDFFGYLNTGGRTSRVIADQAGIIDVTGNGSGNNADWRFAGHVSTLALSRRAIITGLLTNGQSYTLTATAGPPLVQPGPTTLNISGTIAGLTIVLPDENIITDGLEIPITSIGTVTTITWSSPRGRTLVGLPTTITPSTPFKVKWHAEGGQNLWMIG